MNLINTHPFKLIEIGDQVSFNFGFVFDLGNHWFQESNRRASKKGCRKLVPINMMEIFSKSSVFYLNIYFDRQINGTFGFIYKCEISSEKKGDNSIKIWQNGAQILSQNIIYNGLTQLHAGYCVLSSLKDDEAIYKILQNHVFGASTKGASVKEKEISLKLSGGERKLKYVIYYKISSKLEWKDRKYGEPFLESLRQLKRLRILDEENQKRDVDDQLELEDIPIPSINNPWGIKDVDINNIRDEVSVEYKEINEGSKDKSLLSSKEKKDWKIIYSGESKTLVYILRIAYIYTDGRIDMGKVWDSIDNEAKDGEGQLQEQQEEDEELLFIPSLREEDEEEDEDEERGNILNPDTICPILGKI